MEAVLIDVMGDDLRVANAARVSFHKESNWEKEFYNYDGTKTDRVAYAAYSEKNLSVADQKLIIYLAKHNHWTPFSHVQITMREKVPIFVARQRFKHMVGFTYNEVSRRYVDDVPEFFSPDVWRRKPLNAKQGSSDEVITHMSFEESTVEVKEEYKRFLYLAEEIYEGMIKSGIAPEQARMVLPQSMYTEFYVTGSLAAWARAYRLRSDPHSQQEIQDLAKLWNEVISRIKELEFSWKALTE